MAEDPAPWLEEILQAAKGISPATMSEIRQAAERHYRDCAERWGEAWARHAAREAAKSMLAGAATESDPAVAAAFQAYSEAKEHADRLFAAAVGPDGRAYLDSPEGEVAYDAELAADELYGQYAESHRVASERHYAEVSRALRTADLDFLSSHRAELKAADPEGFKRNLEKLTEDSAASAGQQNGSHSTKGLRAHPALDFPNPVEPGTRARAAASPSATSRSSRPPTRRTL